MSADGGCRGRAVSATMPLEEDFPCRSIRPHPPSPYDLFVGVDIAAATFTTVWIEATVGAKPSRALTLEQSASGFAALHARLCSTGHAPADTLIVMEATSSYWVALATTLAQQGYAVAVINPHQAYGFAKALLQRAKTDALDARVLAHLAATLQPTPGTPPPAIYTELQQRLAERDALIALRQ